MQSKTVALFRNGLGNFILFTPALQALALTDESGKVSVCIDGAWNDNRRQALIDLIEGCPFVDKMIIFPSPELEQYKRFFWTRHTYPSDAFRYFESRAPQCNIGINWAYHQYHEIDFYMGLVRDKFGFTGDTPKQFVPIETNGPIIDKGRLIITVCNGSYIGETASGDLSGSKKWSYFKELVEALRGFYDPCIVKIGYRDELSDVEVDMDFVNKASIKETARIISQSDLFITTDTCNMHIGDALQIPMVVLWGGSLISKNQPINGASKIVKKSLGCQPCHETGRYVECEHFNCMTLLTVNEVMNEVRKVLR